MRPLTKKPEAAALAKAQLLRPDRTHDAATCTQRYARDPASIPVKSRREMMDQERVEARNDDRLRPARKECWDADMVYQPAVPQVDHLAYIAGPTQYREKEGRPTGAGCVLSVHPSLEGHTEILHMGGAISLLDTATVRDAGEIVATGKRDQVIVKDLAANDPRHMKWPITAISTYGWVLSSDPWLGQQHWLPPRHGDRLFGATDRPYHFGDGKRQDLFRVAVQGYILESGVQEDFIDTDGKRVPIPYPVHTADPNLLRSLELGRDFIPEKHPYVPFGLARWFVASLGMGGTDYERVFCRTEIRPDVIPIRPDRIYAGKGWSGWEHFLGIGGRFGTVTPRDPLDQRYEDLFERFKDTFAECRSVMEPHLAYRRGHIPRTPNKQGTPGPSRVRRLRFMNGL